MLANINLLPEKKQKNYSSLLVIGAAAILLAGALAFLFNRLDSEQAELKSLRTQDQTLQEQTAAMQQAAAANASPTGEETLASAVKWTKTYPVHFVPILMKLTNLLPEGGYFTDLAYTEADKLELSVQFETSRDAAFYLNRLKTEVPYFKETQLKKVEEVEQKSTANAENNSADSEETVMPRYKADYSIVLDRAKWKQQKEGDKNDQLE